MTTQNTTTQATTRGLTPGVEFGPSSWIDVPQVKIDAFAEATGDHQWIHVDPEQAAQGPFGTTIGHGYLTLSLLPVMSYEVVPRQDGGMAVNYGLNRVRFPAPVPVGSRVRGTFRVDSVEEFAGGFQAQMTATVEREGTDKPVCVAEVLFRYYAWRGTRIDAAEDRRRQSSTDIATTRTEDVPGGVGPVQEMIPRQMRSQ